MNRSMTESDGSRYPGKHIRVVKKNKMHVAVIFLLLSLSVSLIGPVVNESIAENDPGKEIASETPQKAPEKHPVDKTYQPGIMAISLRDFIRLVWEQNEQIGFQHSEWAISREGVKSAKSIFEPAFIGSFQYKKDNRRNTVQEMVSQGFAAEFQERSRNYQAAVEELVPTGGKLRLGYSMLDFSNSIDDRYGVQRESQMALGLSLTQPLLKGGGIKATMSGIKVAQADADIVFQNYRKEMMRVISAAIASYWDLYLAREKYEMRKESEYNAAEILKENLIRVKIGKMDETEVLEAEAGLALRRSFVSDAEQNIVAATNNLRTFFSSSAAEDKAEIEPAEQLYLEDINPNFTDSLSRAFKFRAEFLSSLRKMDKEDIRLVYAKNQRWPQLDLKGSYNMNGLADSPGNSWDDAMNHDFKSWYVGLELRVPLSGDKKSRSELEATRQRKKQALLELKATEVSLVNDIDTAIKGVQNIRKQVKDYAGIVELNKRLLRAENVKFMAGKGSSRDLLIREEELNKAKEAEIESLVRYKKSLFQLEMAEGTLLDNQGIEARADSVN